jgi:hypothetical protein
MCKVKEPQTSEVQNENSLGRSFSRHIPRGTVVVDAGTYSKNAHTNMDIFCLPSVDLKDHGGNPS